MSHKKGWTIETYFCLSKDCDFIGALYTLMPKLCPLCKGEVAHVNSLVNSQ